MSQGKVEKTDSQKELLRLRRQVRELKEIAARHKRAEELLRALNQASLAIQQVETVPQIFDSIAQQFYRLGFLCSVFFLNEANEGILVPGYLGFEPDTLRLVQNVTGIDPNEIRLDVDSSDVLKRVIHKHETIYVQNTWEALKQVLPQMSDKTISQLISTLNMPSAIIAPMIHDDRALGMFSVHSNLLIPSDIPSITAFAHQLSSAWHRAQLLSRLKASLHDLEQAQHILKVNEALFRSIFHNANDGIILIDESGTVVDANEKILQMFADNVEDVIGKKFTELYFLTPESRPVIEEHFRQAIEGGYAKSYTELKGRHRHGHYVTIEASASLLKQENQQKLIVIIARDITERKKVEESLRESEEKYRSIVENIQDIYYRSDLNGNIVLISPSGARLAGYDSPEKMIGLNIAETFYQNPAERDELARQIFANGEVRNFEVTLKRPDGSLVPVLVNSHLYYDESGQPAGIEGFVLDITQRKETEKAIRRKLEFETCISSISSRFVDAPNIDEAINISLSEIGSLSGASRAYLFLTNDDFGSMSNTHEWCHPGVEPQIHRLQNLSTQTFPWWTKKILARETIHVTDVREMPPEAASEREILESQDIKSLLVLPVIAGDQVAGFIGLDNIFETGTWDEMDLALLKVSSEVIGAALGRKRAEEHILQRNQQLAALNDIAQTISHYLNYEDILNNTLDKLTDILDISHAGVFMVDETTRNLILRIYRGISSDAAELVPPMNLDRTNIGQLTEAGNHLFVSNLADIAAGMPTQAARITTEFNLRSAVFLPLKARGKVRGVMFAATNGERVFTQQEREFLSTVGHQVSTALENIELMQEASKALALAETDRLRSAFLASVSHEMRTPLTSIKGFASTLLQEDVEWSTEIQKEFLRAIDAEADQLTRIVEDILDMSKLEVGAMKLQTRRSTITRVINNMRSMLERLTEKHTLILDIPRTTPSIMIDEVRMSQAIANLVENAAIDSPEGSPIVVKASVQNGQLLISVSHIGEGITSEDMVRYFNPFYRLEENVARRRKGSGLRLAICRGIVESHGGRIWAESAGPGKGTTVHFTIPIPAKAKVQPQQIES